LNLYPVRKPCVESGKSAVVDLKWKTNLSFTLKGEIVGSLESWSQKNERS
jgi:hypothetical protein